MKKPAYFLLFISVLLSSAIIGQKGDFTLTFIGYDAATNNPIMLEKVNINNLDQDCDTTVYGPEPQITLSWVDGINEVGVETAFQIGQNYPNPFVCSTKFNVRLATKQEISIKLINIYGSVIQEYTDEMIRGDHTFDISIGQSGIYHLEVSNGRISRIIKLINQGNSNNSNPQIRPSGAANYGDFLKTDYQNRGFLYKPGDELQFTISADNYPDQIITEIPTGEMSFDIDMQPAPVANFHVDTESGIFPLHTTFSGESMHHTDSWLWNFGDGNTSTLQNPDHIFETSGTYTVSLIAYNDYGSDTVAKENFIQVKDVEIYCDTTSGYVPLTVHLNGASNLPNITYWSWDLDDGTHKSGQNIVHGFMTEDTYYEVKLTVVSDGVSYFAEKTIHTLNDLAEVNFTADVIDGWAPQIVQFTGYTNMDNPTGWQWSFGDGGTSLDQNPVHTYQNPGIYTVILSVYDANGYKTEVKEEYITIRYCTGVVADSEGNVYETIGIGKHCWMKENLNIGTRIDGLYGGQTDNGILEKFCFDDDVTMCDKYGGLYQWDELLNYNDKKSNQGLCPDGWHVSTKAEWADLFDSQGGSEVAVEKLKSDNGWYGYGDGTNSSGFNAKPAGDFDEMGYFSHESMRANFWTTDEQFPYGFYMDYNNHFKPDYYSVVVGYSARCVKDITLKK